MELSDDIVVSLRQVEPTRLGLDMDSFMLEYNLLQISGGKVALSVKPFNDYSYHPLYHELVDQVKPDGTVIGLEMFYPYGLNRVEQELGKGLGSLVMDEIVMRDSEAYDARMLYCETSRPRMQGLLEKYDFVRFDSGPWFTLDAFYKVL